MQGDSTLRMVGPEGPNDSQLKQLQKTWEISQDRYTQTCPPGGRLWAKLNQLGLGGRRPSDFLKIEFIGVDMG